MENQRQVSVTGVHEPRVKERELLVEQLRACRRVVLEGDGRGCKPPEDRLCRYLGDVVQHPAVLALSVQLSGADSEGYRAHSVLGVDCDSNPSYVPSWLEPTVRLRRIVKAE
jgi:hypothetical protein